MKFGNGADGPDAGVVELAYHRMAAAAGISVCRSWLAGSGPRRRGWFVTERFDRSPRQHVHSACGLLHVDHRVPALDYTALLEAVRWLTRDQRAVEEAWRRAAFNVLAHNRDDHTRNSVFRMSADGVWALASAFDLPFSPGPG